MKKTNFRYKYFDRAVIRTPLFPLDALRRPDDYLTLKTFQEAVFIASPEMFRAKGIVANDKGKAEKVENSLYKYFSRASTRCTPFGLFAGCSSVAIGDESEITLSETTKYRRCTRLDMQYICALIRKLENSPEIRTQLKFYPNDSIYNLAGQLRYVEYHYKNTRRIHQISSVESSEYVKLVLESAKAGLKPVELAELLIDDDITMNEALEFIDEMIDSQLLKSELDPAVVGEDILTVLIRQLENIDTDIVRNLLQIQQLLSTIDNLPIGESLPLYDKIVEIIKNIGVGYEEKFLFQTDMFKPVESGGVDVNTIENLNDCLMFLSRINHTYQNNNLQKFKQDFAELYEHEEVRLTQVLDNELGLGYPSKNANNDINDFVDDLFLPPVRRSGENRTPVSPVDLILLRKYVQAIKNENRVITVDDSDFPAYDHAETTYPDTCGVMCSIMKNEFDNPIIYLKSAGSGGASLLGRFCHIDRDIDGLVKRTADFEKSVNKNCVIAEISHLPESRIGNIVSRPVFRDTIIRYLSNADETACQVIHASDLLISTKNNRLYLRSQHSDKEICPKLTCAHNYSITPIPIYRFLCDMQTQSPQASFYLQWGELFKTFEYVPRIQYKNIILSRERWTITSDELKDCYKLPDRDLLSFFEAFTQRRKLTNRIVIPEGDNEMYIDLTDIRSIKLMLSLVKRKSQFEVYEYLFSEYKSIVLSENGQHYANETIIIFHK